MPALIHQLPGRFTAYFSGASLPKALKVPVTAEYEIEMPDLMPRFTEENIRLGLPLDLSLDVNNCLGANRGRLHR